jgi:hypothetical protein
MTLTSIALADSNKWRLKVNGSSNSDGVIVLEFDPKGDDKFQVEIAIEDGMRENRVANRIEEELKDELDDDYRISRDDFEDVMIKKEIIGRRFDLKIVSNTVDGVDIDLDKE